MPRSLLVLFVFAGSVFAQDFRATLSGQVTDPSGSVIPAATVKATHIGTNETKETTTTSDGLFTLPYLSPGLYNIEISANGFQTLRRESITLAVAQKLNLPIRMTVGQMSQEVTVVGQQEVIDTGSADRGLVFDPIKTQELPLNGRQSYMLMSLTPGVTFTQEQFGSSGFSGTRGWDVNSSYKINGARAGGGMNMFLLNGAPITDNTNGQWQLAPNVEAIEEFKVMTNTYDATFGRFAGGVVNTTIKSGSNRWHGDVFEYWRNRILDANNFQNNVAGIPKGFHNQHQFGGVLGGPIRKNKDFIFVSFEGWQEVVPFPALASTPPVLLRDGQHFTDFGYKIFDPLTTHPCTVARDGNCQGQAFAHDPFPGNVIPLNRISPVGAKIVGFFPTPNTTGLSNNFVAGQNLGRYYYEQPMARYDHVFGPNDKLFAMYTGQQGYEYRSVTGFPRPVATGNTNNQRTDQNAILDETHVFNARAVMDVRLSFGRFIQTTPGFSDFSLTAQSLGMTGLIPSPTSPGPVAPSISVGDYSGALFSGGTAFSWTATNNWNLHPSVTLTRGRHTIRTGVEMNYAMRGATNTGSSNGQFTFNSTWTQQFSSRRLNNLDGSSIATLLLGYPTGGSINYANTFYRTRPYYGFYVQDDWKVTQRLTLNIGLRYELQIPWIERYDRQNRGFDTSVKNPLSDQIIAAWKTAQASYNAANPNAKFPYPAPPAVINGSFLFPGVNGQPRRLYDLDKTNVSPRIGFAYRIGDKTVLRGGFGISYQQATQENTTTGFAQSTPYTISLNGDINSGTPSAGTSLNGPYSLVNPFPQGIFVPQGAKGGALTGVGNGISFDGPHFRIPRTYQASFGLQRELWKGMVVEAAYSWNYQNHIPFGYNFDRQSLTDLNTAIADPSYFSRSLPNPMFGILPVTTTLGASPNLSADNLLRPNPLFAGMTDNLVQQGRYYSNQLQVKIERRMLGGESTGVLIFGLSYAFGKAIEQNHLINPFVNDPIKELDNTNKAQNLSFHMVWDLPFGQGRRFLNFQNRYGRGLVSGWRFDSIFTYASGNPTGWPNLINLCGDWHATNQNENSWFNNNKACYTQFATNVQRLTPDRFPDIQDPAVGPFINAALEKYIGIGERYKVLLRGEVFNLTNHAQRGGPDTGFTSDRFGQLPKSQLNFPRVFQLAAKFYF